MTHSSMAPVRVGLLGVGGRLRGVMRGVLDHSPAGAIRVVSAYDPRPESILAARTELDDGVVAAHSEEAVVNDPAVDWVFIGSWNSCHARQAVLALEAGKNVFCEKPLAITVEQCCAIREAAARSGRQFALGLVLRYSPHYRKVHEILTSGAIGTIFSFEFNETLGFNHGGYIFGNWRRRQQLSGGHLLEKCCHDFDLVHWMLDALPIRVASFGGRDFFVPKHSHRIGEIGPNAAGVPAYQEWSYDRGEAVDCFGDAGADICDNQIAILEYANGVRGTFHTNCHAAIVERRMYFVGSHGALRADVITGMIETARIGWDDCIETIDSGVRGGHGGADDVMAQSLVRTLLHGEPPLASVQEGICSAAATLGVDQARETGAVLDMTAVWAQTGIDPRRPFIRCRPVERPARNE